MEAGFIQSPFVVPLGAFVMVIVIVAITQFTKMREKESAAHQELRQREMEHEREIKKMEIEKAKLEVERARLVKS